jgi:hypothetical protein
LLLSFLFNCLKQLIEFIFFSDLLLIESGIFVLKSLEPLSQLQHFLELILVLLSDFLQELSELEKLLHFVLDSLASLLEELELPFLMVNFFPFFFNFLQMIRPVVDLPRLQAWQPLDLCSSSSAGTAGKC